MSISSRLTALEAAAANSKSGKIAVTFRDGTVKLLEGGECVDLVMHFPDTVERFETKGSGHGLLPDLLNDLLND